MANYGGFYRLPLGAPEAIADAIATRPGNFGYDEATRQFRLPPPSGATELNVFASRSTIDTGVMTLFSGNLYNTNGNSLDRQDLQQDLTVNNSLGSRLGFPVKNTGNFQSGLSSGLDFKAYELTSAKTNVFTLSSVTVDYGNDPSHPQTNVTRPGRCVAGAPPRAGGWIICRWRCGMTPACVILGGVTTLGLGLSGNPWFSGSLGNLRSVSGSSQSSGHWVTLTPSLGRDLVIRTNWVLSLRADGHWASEPPDQQ